MSAVSERRTLIEIEGEARLLDGLAEAVRVALADQGTSYHVRIDGVGRCGEVMVRITGSKGRLPLLFDAGELEPAYVGSVIRRTVEKYAFC
jgi:hypothetical protein